MEKTSRLVLLLLSTIMVCFIFFQYAVYAAFVDNITDRGEREGGMSHLRPGAGAESIVSGLHLRETREHLPLSVLQAEGGVTLGLVVRAHAGYAAALISLLWSLQAQESGEGDRAGAATLVVVVPTEPGSAAVLLEHVSRFTDAYVLAAPSDTEGELELEGGWRGLGSGMGQTLAVLVLNPSARDFEEKRHVLAALCTEEWRQDRLQGGWPVSALDRYCAVNSPVHYHLTDLGIACLLRLAPHLPALVVTNADNAYLPSFSSSARAFLRAGGLDVALVDMLHRGQPMAVRPELGHMDLGCAVIRTAILVSAEPGQQGQSQSSPLTFAQALPAPAAPEHWHDADFWWVDALVKRKHARVGVLHEFLFVHN